VSISHVIERTHEIVSSRPPTDLGKAISLASKELTRFLETVPDCDAACHSGSFRIIHGDDRGDQTITPIDELGLALAPPQHLGELLLGLPDVPRVLVHLIFATCPTMDVIPYCVVLMSLPNPWSVQL
jgi:hypothetical protein